MANNRLYILDTATGERLMLAKGWSVGWEVWQPEELGERLQQWLDDHADAAAVGGGTVFRLVTEDDQ